MSIQNDSIRISKLIQNQTPLKFCTYLTVYTGNKMPMYYIGYTKTSQIYNKNYRGSVSSKAYKEIWLFELKENFHLFKIYILSYHDNKNNAIENEIKFQKQFQVHKNKMFMNLSINNEKWHNPGGHKLSEEQKKKISDRTKGIKKGPHSEERKRNISKNHADVSGKNNPMYGKKFSDETKIKMSEKSKLRNKGQNNPMYGKTHTHETKNKLSLHGKEKWNNGSREKMIKTLSKGIYVTPWGNFISITYAINDANCFIKDPGTLKTYCINNKKFNKKLKTMPIELGFDFILN